MKIHTNYYSDHVALNYAAQFPFILNFFRSSNAIQSLVILNIVYSDVIITQFVWLEMEMGHLKILRRAIQRNDCKPPRTKAN